MSTGYVYEDIFTKHDFPGHPENAHRLVRVMSYLKEQGLLEKLTQVPARPATTEELLRCHQLDHIELVESVCAKGGGMLDPDTYSNEFSNEAALNAVGGLIDLTGAVIDRELDNGFALVRPPGHHATPERAMGFCLFGNVAVAAKAAIADKGLQRVAVIDFDVHHGNGTQAILDDDPNIFFVSSHQYPFYPGTGSINDIGTGDGRGTKLNIPLMAKTDDGGFKRLYSEVVFPAIRRFKPELLLISIGFDAHWKDPLANIDLSLEGYYWLCEKFVELADELCEGRIVFTLEGGYDVEVLAPGVGNVFRALMHDENYDDDLGQSFWAGIDVWGQVSQLKQLHNLE